MQTSQSTEKRTNRETDRLSLVPAGSKPCEFCDGVGAVAVAPSYYASRNSRIVDATPRLEVCFGCLGTGVTR